MLLDLFCIYEAIAVMKLLEFLLETVDTRHLNPIANACQNDTDADKSGECGSTDSRLVETIHAESRSSQSEDEHYPPEAEADMLEIKGFDSDTHSLEQHNKSKDERECGSQRHRIDDEEHAHQDLQKCRQEEQSALRQNEVQPAPCGKFTTACNEEYQP